MDKKLIRISKNEVVNLTYDEILEKYKGLVIKLINKWIFKYEFDDLYQIGIWGLWDAYKFHDVNNGNCFGTLAEKTIIYYISWYRQNNNKDKIKRETSQINDICSYNSHDGYIDVFYDTKDYFYDVEMKIIINDLLNKLKKENEFLRAHERRASERNIEFLKLISIGITQREIAEKYNLSLSTVQRGLYKEFNRIKKFLRATTYKEMLEV